MWTPNHFHTLESIYPYLSIEVNCRSPCGSPCWSSGGSPGWCPGGCSGRLGGSCLVAVGNVEEILESSGSNGIGSWGDAWASGRASGRASSRAASWGDSSCNSGGSRVTGLVLWANCGPWASPGASLGGNLVSRQLDGLRQWERHFK